MYEHVLPIFRTKLVFLAGVLLLTSCDTPSDEDGVAQTTASGSSTQAVAPENVSVTPNRDWPPLPLDVQGQVESLPQTYPEHWFIVQEVAFYHMLDGKAIVLDVSMDTVPEQVKGTFNVSLVGNFAQSVKHGEFYVAETYHARGVRGARTDVVTVYDKTTLAPVAEIVWPQPKRFQGMPGRYAMTLIDDDSILLVFNFNPATSVTVIDVQRGVLLPRCRHLDVPWCTRAAAAGLVQSAVMAVC